MVNIKEEDTRSYIVYVHTNLINGKQYVGQTCQSLIRRTGLKGQGYRASGAKDSDSGHTKFYNAILKYGWENFSHEILKENLTASEADYWEQYYIQLFHTWIDDPQCNGYNMTKGGQSHIVLAQETLEYMSEIKRGDKSPTAKTIICLNTGEIFTTINAAAEKYKISRSSLSRVINKKDKYAGIDPETKTRLQWEIYDENKEYIPLGLNPIMEQPIYTKKDLELKTICHAKPVMCIETDVIFISCVDASRRTNINRVRITHCCMGKQKIAGHYHWEYLSKEEFLEQCKLRNAIQES